MGAMGDLRVLLLPGWQNSDPDHWQSRWEAQHGWPRLQQSDWIWPRRGDWMVQLEENLLAEPQPTLLVAHSLGCHLVAAWAAHSRHTARVAAALLVAPPDLERPDLPPQVQGWAPLQRRPLPFPSTLVLSRDDPFCAASRSLALAADWGSEVHKLGAAGHINADSGLADWPAGIHVLAALARRAGFSAPVPAG